jgi:hypothetical protein
MRIEKIGKILKKKKKKKTPPAGIPKTEDLFIFKSGFFLIKKME